MKPKLLDYKGIEFKIMEITPAFAAGLLKLNGGNRRISRQRIDDLIQALMRGEWKLNGETICWNKTTLINGQHRLMACVESGVSIVSFVVIGLPSEVFDTVDQGRPRSGGDVLGQVGEKNPDLLSAALKFIQRIEDGTFQKCFHSRFTNSEIIALRAKYPEAPRSAEMIAASKTKGLAQPSLLTACHYLFSRRDDVAANGFMEALTSGVNLAKDDPIYLLRERLQENALSPAKLGNIAVVALIIKAWNAKTGGVQPKLLRYRQMDGFPVIR